MAKAQAMGALLMTVPVVLATSAEVAHGICNLSSDGIRECQPAAAIRNPTDQPRPRAAPPWPGPTCRACAGTRTSPACG
ncbi:putative lipid-transfer protein DIR1 [Panicum miliaceum]|uniref:Lipid-transfer protein DIR1 n=1 Tax=Panicum miliaceum TaxID=4540 RepID=A0A3L6QSF5_PANMI|nr:putative lipid-transfer protein DIR1 [Panicum miliaceum]